MFIDDSILDDAEAGSPYAALAIAYLYHTGKGVDQDSRSAVEWYMKSAELGCPRAKWELTKAFRDGTLVVPDSTNYLYYLKKAASSGIPEARYELAMLYMNGDFVPKDYQTAYNWIHLAADQNLPEALFAKGYMLGHGIGVGVNHNEEEDMYMKVGIYGSAELFFQIGKSYEYGLYGAEVNKFEAGRWYKNGADMGHEGCIISWASLMDNMKGNPQESLEERNFRLSHTTASKDRAELESEMERADALLNDCYYLDAMDAYERAAKLGSSVAMFTLALIYHDGDIIRRNDSIAIEYMKKSAAAGNEDALYFMGTFHETGSGVPRDINEAIHNFVMSAANGNLFSYYKLSKYMDHPEIYVRNSVHTILR